jgi:hypothetical protein
MRVVHSVMRSCALWNRAASSAYVANAMTFLIMLMILCTATLRGSDVDVGEGVTDVLLGWLLRKKVPPTRLRACALERYEISM